MRDFNEHRGSPVSFRLFPSMPDMARYILVALLMLAGFGMQTQIGFMIPGIICLTCASLLLMFKGIDKRIFQYTVSETNNWVKTEKKNIQEMIQIVKELNKWDKNIFEISNLPGCLFFLAVCAVLGLLFASGVNHFVVLDVLALFVPVFFSGMLKTDSRPAIMIKTENIVLVASYLRQKDQSYDYTYYTLLSPVKNKKKPAPRDIKLKINPSSQSEKFLGIYAQCTLNNVSGTFYPYVYFVIVYGRDTGLKAKIENIIGNSHNICREYSETSDAEVLIIRQTTTKTSGYQTKPKDILKLLDYTLKVYEERLA